jgi:ACS family D-galactonate transporter-like MFS transporter
LFMLSVFGGGIAAANMLTVPASIAPAGKAGVIGAIQQMAGNFGGIVAPIVTGALYDQTHDFTRAVIAAGAMLVVSGFGYIVLLPRIQPLSFEAHSEREDDQAVRQTIT